jgi:hypothetical protein
MPSPANMIQKLRQAQKQLLNAETLDTNLVIWGIEQLGKEIEKLEQAEVKANRRLNVILDKIEQR